MYELTKPQLWSGRIDGTARPDMLRLHQVIEMKDIHDLPNEAHMPRSIGIIGFKSDEGVRRNQGRTGSREAPDALRKSMASLPGPANVMLYDFGNIICEGGDLEKAQLELGDAVSSLLGHKIFPIILGGGHEVAYGHYLGHKHCTSTETKIGIVNIDAHFDMRPYDNKPSSGTMFRQILDENKNARYLCAGIQKSGNTQFLFDSAIEYGCEYLLEEEIRPETVIQCLEKISLFVKNSEKNMLTLCCDVLEASSAPGVSAPSPFGLHPRLVRTLIRELAANPAIRSFDIAEVNPALDEGERTIKLAALLVYEVILARDRITTKG